jgi:hypothetical protein
MRLRIVFIVSALLIVIHTFSQFTTPKSKESMKAQADCNMLMFFFDYASNTNVMGNFIPENRQPSFSPSIVFFSRWGADVSAIGNFIGNSDDSLDNFTTELDLTVGYTFKPFKNLTFYPSYAHFFYSDNSNALKSMFKDDIRLDIDYNYKIVNLGISAGYFMGKQHTFYAIAHNDYRFNINRFLFRNASLSIQPGIDANFGSYEYLNLYYLEKLKQDQWYYGYFWHNYPAIRQYVYKEKIRHPNLTYRDIIDNYLGKKARDNFKLTSIGVNLPIFYMIGNWGINLGIYAFIPLQAPDYLSDEILFFFDIGLSCNLVFK